MYSNDTVNINVLLARFVFLKIISSFLRANAPICVIFRAFAQTNAAKNYRRDMITNKNNQSYAAAFVLANMRRIWQPTTNNRLLKLLITAVMPLTLYLSKK